MRLGGMTIQCTFYGTGMQQINVCEGWDGVIHTRQKLQEWIQYERNQYGLPSGIVGFLLYVCGNEKAAIWHYQKRLRCTEYHYNAKHRIRYLWSTFLLNRLRIHYGMNIGLNTCGKGLKIMHVGSILINGNARLGENCALHINTALVAKGTTDAAPILGSGVVVGVGAAVVGGVRVAKNVAIGANAVVTRDIDEEDIAVAGIPARKVSANGRTCWGNRKKMSE